MTSAAFRPVATPLERPLRLGVLISGGGTTLANFVAAIAAGTLHAEIPLVIASRANCGGIEKARRAGLRCEVVPRKEFASVEAFSDVIFEKCRAAQVDLITLAGFLSMLKTPPDFQWRMMNVHPGLIPSFCGKGFYGHHVHEAVVARGVKISGCTVHFVDDEYDHGPIIVQRIVPVLDDDTPDTLAARVFEAECIAYPEAICLFAEGRLTVEKGRTRISGPPEMPLR